MVGLQASHQYDNTKILLIFKPQNNSAIIFYIKKGSIEIPPIT